MINEKEATQLLTSGAELAIAYVPKFLLALLVLYFGFKLANYSLKMIDKILVKNNIDPSLKPFLEGVIGSLLKIIILVASLGMMGIETTSFVTMLGAAGLAVGLALQGSLSNLAGGVLILIFRPFNVGDFVEAQGFSGKVKEIQILYTILNTVDNKVVIIPNGSLANGNIINYSREKLRRVDLLIGVSYDSDIKEVKEIIENIILNQEEVIKDNEDLKHLIRVKELADSSVNFTVRVWVDQSNYWSVYFDLIEKIKLKFDENNIEIPFPQRDFNVKGLEKLNIK